MPVSAPPPDKRFRRAHLRPSKRRDSWRGRLFRGLAAAGVVLLFAVLVSGVVGYAVTSSTLRIQRITVSGNQRLSTGQVQALLGHLIGSSTVAADIKQARRKLQDARWVEHVEIRRVFPDSVSVVLTERQAIALGRIKGELYLIDREGVIIDEYGPNYSELDLPIVNGLSTGQSPEMLLDEQRAMTLKRFIGSLRSRPDLAALVSEIDLRDPLNVEVMLEGDTVAVRLGQEKFVERLETYAGVASELKDRVTDIDYVDARYVPSMVVGLRGR
jgi:cell division septal protein FtsQ